MHMSSLALAVLVLLATVVCSSAQRTCCKANTLGCLACAKGVSLSQYCISHPLTPGCPPGEPEPRACCMALTASCMSCSEGVTEQEFCAHSPSTVGCPVQEVSTCCEAQTSECLSCAKGVAEISYCRHHPLTEGCEKMQWFSMQEIVRMCAGLVILVLGLVWGLFERRRRRTSSKTPLRNGQYFTGLFDCFKHPRLCFPACIFTPVLAAFNRAEVDDRECDVCDVCFSVIKPVAQYTTRQSIRGKYQLSSDSSDACVACCCTPCAVAQDSLELERRASQPTAAPLPAGLVAPGIPMYSMPPTAPTVAGVVYTAVGSEQEKEQDHLVWDNLKEEAKPDEQV
eukprot:TRINITY_DN401_c0_g1_i1.p1 TRINITY_DN401_c0_g1~~TRINITY_DN401_c0_g1_i1.p1  ORF type:complete len:340 (+),score=35.58 TRINITY_DN401_c0_g1_i1:220-1239(+)